MYENDNLNSFPKDIEDITNTEQNEEIIAETSAGVGAQPEQAVSQETVSTGFVMVETPEAEDNTAKTEPVQTAASSAPQEQNIYQGIAPKPTAQGAFSGSYVQQNASAQQDTFAQQAYSFVQGSNGAPIYSAKDIQPRKKMGWGKKLLVLLLCGILLGGSAACAYFGVTQLIEQFNKDDEVVTLPSEVIVKEPEIEQVEPVIPAQPIEGVAYDVSGVVENVMPAMVSVINTYTETINSFWGQSYTQQGASSGSGIIIGENETELLIATNYHVVSGSDSIEITFIDGSTANAYIKGTDPQMDLAVVSVVLEELTAETKAAIAVASLGDSEALKLGQPVIAIGNALGYGQSVTTGVVSAIDREIDMEDGTTGSFIQTDAAINPGNSGGALLNLQGQVIGINSSKIGGSTIEGMGFAIPINAAEPIISDLSLQTTKIKVDEAERGYLGVGIQEVTATISQMYGMPQGVFIGELVEGGAAEKAGMQLKDIIVQFDSFRIDSYADLQEALQYYAAGTTVEVTVMRPEGGEYVSVTLELTLGERPAQ